MKKMMLLTMVVLFCGVSIAQASTEWYGTTGIVGQDSDWFNPLNWTNGVPGSSDYAYWRYAAEDHAVYNPIVISGGNAVSGTSVGAIWYAGTNSITVTNGARYDISGNLNLHNGAADAAHSPANTVLTVNGGSTMTVSGETQVGRMFMPANGQSGQCTINIDGPGTTFIQTNYMWLGWGVGATENTLFSVTNGALAQFEASGGLYMKQDGDLVKISVDGGTIKVKNDRRVQYNGYKAGGWLVGWDGTPESVDVVYDQASNYTVITSVPEPVSITLLGLGVIGILRRKNR